MVVIIKMFTVSKLVGNFVGGEISSIVKLICRSQPFSSLSMCVIDCTLTFGSVNFHSKQSH